MEGDNLNETQQEGNVQSDQQPNQMNTETQTPTNSEPKGPLIGIIIIVVLLIIGGIFVWMSRTDTDTNINGNNNIGTTLTENEIVNLPDPSVDALNTQSDSDEIEAIESDLDNIVFWIPETYYLFYLKLIGN